VKLVPAQAETGTTRNDMMKKKMKGHILFFLFGIVLGAAIFWLPTFFWSGNGFALPVLFLFGPWYLMAIPYLAIFALIFGLFILIYRFCKKRFPITYEDGAWILLGLYLSLTFLFHFIGITIKGGNLTI
jgi:hypothetical protein